MEKRLLLAFVLSAVIFAVWSVLFAPPEPPPRTEPAVPTDNRQPTALRTEADRPTVEEAPPPALETAPDVEVEAAAAGEREESIELANDQVVIEFTTRGAAIRSFKLLDYRGDEGEPLDLVQSVPDPRRSLPLQLVQDDRPDDRLYAVQRGPDWLEFRWSDGRGTSARKRVVLPEWGYALQFEMERRGSLATSAVSVGTGLRDLSESERNSRLARWGDAVVLADGEYQTTRRDKVKEPRLLSPRSVAYIGLHDAYFLEVVRPTTPVSGIEYRSIEYAIAGAGEEPEVARVLQVLVQSGATAVAGELLGAPKEYRLLHQIGGGVERTLDFGFFGPISVLFLKALWWIHGIVGNYGVAIVLLTVAIRILLFPLMHTSTVSMRKMQKLQPRVKEIQAKYKKKKGDPEARAKMNQEMMALYKAEGVNPMGGCLPMLVQLPILWALYKLFLNAIELRHAPFVLWITDLSAKDPYYITPILMTATMWLQQRLAPQAGDPQQQRIMRMMPLIFGIMFLQFPSGLVLYWLTNNVLTIIQQELTLHLVGERKRGSGKGAKA
jgi:YidC/Oxa1 family membrane protein insertase